MKYKLLAPGAAIFAVRALYEYFEVDMPTWLGPVTGITGALSFVGLLWIAWKSSDAGRAGLAAAVALWGHFAMTGDAGSSLVYLGMGIAGSLWHRGALTAGFVAFVGVATRADDPSGHLLVALGAAWLAWRLLGKSDGSTQT